METKINIGEKFRSIIYNSFDSLSEVNKLIVEKGWAVKSNSNRTKLPKNIPNATHFILSGDHGGVLSIPSHHETMFMDAYCRDIQANIRHYIREQRTQVFPLAVDLDYKPKTDEQKWEHEHIRIWVKIYQFVLRKCYAHISDSQHDPQNDPFLCIVTNRLGDYAYEQEEPVANHGFLKPKDFKQGFRFSFPNLLVTSETALTIRQCVLRELVSNGDDCRALLKLNQNSLIDENVLKQFDVMLDESVYLTNGFRMIGSAKVQASACGKKANGCFPCNKNEKFDIGCIYRLWSVFPFFINDSTTQNIRHQLIEHYSKIDMLIRACSVRNVENKPETPGFKCAYDISMYFLATTKGAQSISRNERKMVSRTDRLFDISNKEDRLKYDTFLRYLQTTTFPPNFPYNQMTLHDIKSIHLGITKTQKTYMILLHTQFCALKNANHSSAKSNIIVSSNGGIRQKCLSQTCNSLQTNYYNMPPMPIDMFHVFFPTNALSEYCEFKERNDKQNAEKDKQNEKKVDEQPEPEQSMDQMLDNMSIYLPSKSDVTYSIGKQVQVTREITHLLKYQMLVYDDYCRTQSVSVNPRPIYDSNLLVEEYERKQGTNNNVFRSRVGRGGGGGGGRGGGSRKRRRESDSDSD